MTAGLTAFYMFRAFFVVFFGDREFEGKAHESPAVMVGPMGVLAILAVVGGALGPGIARLLEHSISVAGHHEAPHAGMAAMIPYLGTGAAVLGILIAWLGYQRRAFRPETIRAAAGPLATLLERRYYVDEVFLFFYRVLYLGLGSVVGWIDRYVIDGLVNFVSWATWQIAGQVRRVQTGRAQDALYAIAIGFLLLVILAMRG